MPLFNFIQLNWINIGDLEIDWTPRDLNRPDPIGQPRARQKRILSPSQNVRQNKHFLNAESRLKLRKLYRENIKVIKRKSDWIIRALEADSIQQRAEPLEHFVLAIIYYFFVAFGRWIIEKYIISFVEAGKKSGLGDGIHHLPHEQHDHRLHHESVGEPGDKKEVRWGRAISHIAKGLGKKSRKRKRQKSILFY